MATRLLFKVAVLMALIAATLTFAACGDDDGGIVPSGNVVTKTFELTDFDGVQFGLYDAEIDRADDFSVTVWVNDNLAEFVEAEVKGDTLDLRFKPDGGVNGKLTLEAVITMPAISRLDVAGTGSALVSGFGPSDSLDLVVSGASGVGGAFEATDVSVVLSGASSIDGGITATNFDATVSGASSIALSGSADALVLDLSGASHAELSEFEATTAGIELSGASNALVNVSDVIDPAVASGASTLLYLGDPELRNVNTTGASSVKMAD